MAGVSCILLRTPFPFVLVDSVAIPNSGCWHLFVLHSIEAHIVALLVRPVCSFDLVLHICYCSQLRKWECTRGFVHCLGQVPPEHALDIRKQSLALCKREKLQRHLRMVGGEFSLQQPKRPLLQPQQRRLAWRREAEQQRKWQHQRMKLGIKANTLQRTILKETKFFL